jgi:hypothetical protein
MESAAQLASERFALCDGGLSPTIEHHVRRLQTVATFLRELAAQARAV